MPTGRREKPQVGICQECGTQFTKWSHIPAKWCSASCRCKAAGRAYRARQKALKAQGAVKKASGLMSW